MAAGARLLGGLILCVHGPSWAASSKPGFQYCQAWWCGAQGCGAGACPVDSTWQVQGQERGSGGGGWGQGAQEGSQTPRGPGLGKLVNLA